MKKIICSLLIFSCISGVAFAQQAPTKVAKTPLAQRNTSAPKQKTPTSPAIAEEQKKQKDLEKMSAKPKIESALIDPRAAKQ